MRGYHFDFFAAMLSPGQRLFIVVQAVPSLSRVCVVESVDVDQHTLFIWYASSKRALEPLHPTEAVNIDEASEVLTAT